MRLKRLGLLLGMAVTATACSGSEQLAEPSEAESVVFVRQAASVSQVWQWFDDRQFRIVSNCGDVSVRGTPVDGQFVPLDASEYATCPPGDELPVFDEPFTIARTDTGLTATVGDEVFTFDAPTQIPLDPVFSDEWFRVAQASPAGIERDLGAVWLRIDGDRIEGRANCGAFETSMTVEGSTVSTGDVRYQSACAGLGLLFDLLASRDLVALGSDLGPSIWAGPHRWLALEPADAPVVPSGELDATFVRQEPTVLGRFHATEYLVGDEVRATAPDNPFRLELTESEASWYSDCNETRGSVLWTGTSVETSSVSQTAMGCPDSLSQQAQDLRLSGEFDLIASEAGWTLHAGALSIDLVAGPPNGLLDGIPAASWTYSNFSAGMGTLLGGEAEASFVVDRAGAAVLATPCRSIQIDLSGSSPIVVDVGQSSCAVPDGIDAWIVSIVEHDRLTLTRQYEEIGLWSPGASVVFRQTS